MKKILIILSMLIYSYCAFAQVLPGASTYTVTSTPSPIVIPVYSLPGFILITPQSGSVTLSNNFSIDVSAAPPAGKKFYVAVNPTFNLNGHTMTIFGQNVTADQIASDQPFIYSFTVNSDGATYFYTQQPFDLSAASVLSGDIIMDGTLPIAKLDTVGSARILIGNSSNILTSRLMGGDATLNNTGTITLASTGVSAGTYGNSTQVSRIAVNAKGLITTASNVTISVSDSNVASTAAISLSKLAALTASKPVVTNSSGVLTVANQISPALGGTGQDFSASTGFVTISAGTFSAGTINESMNFLVSFDSTTTAGEWRGDNKVKMPCAGTITGIYAFAQTKISGADNGTIVAKNAAGTTMTNGTVTFTASDTRGTAYSISPSANNTFSSGDVIDFLTAKPTPGGNVLLTVTYTRAN